MRRITVSVLSVLLALPAFADARLPVVNIAGAGVSARAAFGEMPVAPVQTRAAAPQSDENVVAVAPLPKTAPQKSETKKVVTRAAARPAVDTGAQIAALDVLNPNRPSADLWAKNDTPLRMPNPSEFSVLSANYDLPEESLNTAPRVASVAPAAQPMSEMDAQIARLVELQRKADESVKKNAVAVAPSVPVANVAPRVASVEKPIDVFSPVSAAPVAPAIDDTPRIASVATPAPAASNDDVHLSRLVVPMSQDVVIRTVEKNTSPRIAAVRDDMTKMSPTELRKAFRKTFLSENKHLSTFQIDDRFDVASDMSSGIEGFTAQRDLSEVGGIRPLEIKIRFRNEDSALSRENYNLLTEYASIVVSNPKRAIQVAIPQSVASNMDARKLAARRLAIVEQVLRDTGVSEQRIMPVLSQRDEEGFVLRIISNDQFETLTQKQRDMFGDTVSKKTYKSMSW